MQERVRKLVEAGQIEFVNGGWCMHDEATCQLHRHVDQTTLGHRTIKEQFNKAPRAGWQIDPFGHSAVQAYLLAAEDNPLLFYSNVEKRVNDFINAAITQIMEVKEVSLSANQDKLEMKRMAWKVEGDKKELF